MKLKSERRYINTPGTSMEIIILHPLNHKEKLPKTIIQPVDQLKHFLCYAFFSGREEVVVMADENKNSISRSYRAIAPDNPNAPSMMPTTIHTPSDSRKRR